MAGRLSREELVRDQLVVTDFMEGGTGCAGWNP